jgi:hypothetical protein
LCVTCLIHAQIKKKQKEKEKNCFDLKATVFCFLYKDERFFSAVE